MSPSKYTPGRPHNKYVYEEAKADILDQEAPFNLNIYIETVKQEIEDDYRRQLDEVKSEFLNNEEDLHERIGELEREVEELTYQLQREKEQAKDSEETHRERLQEYNPDLLYTEEDFQEFKDKVENELKLVLVNQGLVPSGDSEREDQKSRENEKRLQEKYRKKFEKWKLEESSIFEDMKARMMNDINREKDSLLQAKSQIRINNSRKNQNSQNFENELKIQKEGYEQIIQTLKSKISLITRSDGDRSKNMRSRSKKRNRDFQPEKITSYHQNKGYNWTQDTNLDKNRIEVPLKYSQNNERHQNEEESNLQMQKSRRALDHKLESILQQDTRLLYREEEGEQSYEESDQAYDTGNQRIRGGMDELDHGIKVLNSYRLNQSKPQFNTLERVTETDMGDSCYLQEGNLKELADRLIIKRMQNPKREEGGELVYDQINMMDHVNSRKRLGNSGRPSGMGAMNTITTTTMASGMGGGQRSDLWSRNPTKINDLPSQQQEYQGDREGINKRQQILKQFEERKLKNSMNYPTINSQKQKILNKCCPCHSESNNTDDKTNGIQNHQNLVLSKKSNNIYERVLKLSTQIPTRNSTTAYTQVANSANNRVQQRINLNYEIFFQVNEFTQQSELASLNFRKSIIESLTLDSELESEILPKLAYLSSSKFLSHLTTKHEQTPFQIVNMAEQKIEILGLSWRKIYTSNRSKILFLEAISRCQDYEDFLARLDLEIKHVSDRLIFNEQLCLLLSRRERIKSGINDIAVLESKGGRLSRLPEFNFSVSSLHSQLASLGERILRIVKTKGSVAGTLQLTKYHGVQIESLVRVDSFEREYLLRLEGRVRAMRELGRNY